MDTYHRFAKRVLALALAIALCLSAAGEARLYCECRQENCICFIQYMDEGQAVKQIIAVLAYYGYLPKDNTPALFDEAVAFAVLAFQRDAGLYETGMMDDDTLTLLLMELQPVYSEKSISLKPASASRAVWVPTNGGIRHHSKPTCSKMYDPRLVSELNALKMDMQPCGICRPDKNETISMEKYISSGDYLAIDK